MIRRLDHMKNLAIVGMSVAFPCGGGINEFGRLIYRGLLLTGKFGEGLTLETTTIKLVRQVCDEAHLLLDQALIVSLSSTTTQILQNSGTNSRLQEVSDVLSAFSLASDLLESGGENVVLLVENLEKPQAVCLLLVAEHKFALDNAMPIYSQVMGAATADGPMVIEAIAETMREAGRCSGGQPGSI